MSASIIHKKLRSSPFFETFDEDELTAIVSISKIRKIEAGHIIFSELTPANSIFLLSKGHIHLVFDSKRIIDIAQGQIFGDWAIVNENIRFATAKSTVKSEIIEIDSKAIKEFKIDPKLSYKVILQIASTLVSRLVIRSQIASHILIEEGESQFTEFKSSLRWNTHIKKKDDALELACLKTIAGFLNAKGGVLFIGVRDDGSILGVDHDNFENPDKMMLHLNHLITVRLGKEALPEVHLSLVCIKESIVLRVDCDTSHQPIFVKNNNDELFFVRVGNMTQSYSIKNAIDYINHRF